MRLVDRLIREELTSLTPYESARRLYSMADSDEVSVTWLNANENPEVPDIEFNPSLLNRYPDFQPEPLLQGYANYTDLPKQNILATRGADEGIELLIRTFCNRGDSILINPPTYGMYAISAETFNVGISVAPLNSSFELDFEALTSLAEQPQPPKLVFLCSPNNPTGTALPPEQIERCLSLFANKSLVVLDEAYIEFNWKARWSGRLEQYDNLVILRTLSKAFALAGIRCGFTLACNAIIKTLLKVIAPYPIPDPVAQIALQALSSNGIKTMRQQVNIIQQQQKVLKETLASLSELKPVGSEHANFLMFRAQKREALMQYLVSQGMLIRDQSKQLQLQDCLRITVGSDAENAELIHLIQQFYQQETRV